MPLDEIRSVLDDPGFDARSALLAHRKRIATRVEWARELIANIDRMLQGADAMSAEEMFEGFQPEEHTAEARKRWGDSEAWKIAQARTKRYGAEQKRAIRAEHVGLAQLYVSDPRFEKVYEQVAPGLARYVASAIEANAASGDGTGQTEGVVR